MTGEKDRLRRRLLEQRAAISGRREKDRAIFEAVSALPLYQNAGQILCYVSTSQEADTRALLKAALREGKEVFVPLCLPENRLAFYQIFSMEDLRPGRFGILEPDPSRQAMWNSEGSEECKNVLCLVPGVAFDMLGFRLGYGKGYYDRFLAGRKIPCVGLCYRELVVPKLPVDEYDQRVGLLATEEGCVICRGPSPERKQL